MRGRIGLAPLMALIAALALGLAAMKVATEGAARLVTLASIVILLVAMVGARVRRDRAAWVGFSTLGQGYLALVAASMFAPHIMHARGTLPVGVASRDIYDVTTRLRPDGLMAMLADLFHPDSPVPILSFPASFNSLTQDWRSEGPDGPIPLTPQQAEEFAIAQARCLNLADRPRARSAATWIGLAIQGVAFASLGAFIGQFLARTDRRPRDAAPPQPPAEARR